MDKNTLHVNISLSEGIIKSQATKLSNEIKITNFKIKEKLKREKKSNKLLYVIRKNIHYRKEKMKSMLKHLLA